VLAFEVGSVTRARLDAHGAARPARPSIAPSVYHRDLAVDPVDLMLLGCGAVFALNMGGSGLAPSFSVALGAKLISRPAAVVLYGVCVIVGALLLGQVVAKTLSSGIVPTSDMTPVRVLCIIGAATVSLFVANALRVPQSTSWVTVFALVAAGFQIGHLETGVLLHRLLPAWILMPLVAYAVTYTIMRALYPLRPANFRLHERLRRHEGKIRWAVLGTSCYVAMAIGSNNVGNVVGPLAAAGVIGLAAGLAVMAPLFGLGALLFPGPARTVGKSIVPIGPVAASLVSFVVGTMLLCASWYGIPQSLVQLNAAAVIAVWRVKEDASTAGDHPVLRRMLVLWLVTPLISVITTIVLLWIIE
jgi:sulfate permease